jgi:hypothetical protein
MRMQKELRELGAKIDSTIKLAEKLDQKMIIYLLSLASLDLTETIEALQQYQSRAPKDN